MAITISGQNNNDKILASDGVLDSISGFNVVGVMTAAQFDVTGKTTINHLDIGSNIQIGNAGIITATTLIGNVTGNVNATSNLLLQIGGSEKFRVGSSGQLGIGGANYGTSGQVLTSGGSGSAATWSTINSDKITEGNTEAEVVDTGSDGHFKVTTEGTERLRITSTGSVGIGEDAPVAKVHIAGSNYVSVGGGGFDSNVVLAITRNFTVGQSAGLALNSGASATSFIHLGDADDPDIGKITYDHSNNSMSFTTNANERLRIDSAGRLLLGGQSARIFGGGTAPHLQIEGLSEQAAHLTITRVTNDTYGSVLGLAKSRGTSLGSNTIVQNNDTLGVIQFRGTDGSDIYSVAASIHAEVDGSPSDGTDMPGALVLGTTADGASSPTERFRIASDGKVHINYNASSSAGADKLNIMGGGDGITIARSTANASDGNILGNINFHSYMSGSYHANAEAKIQAIADSGQSGSSAPTHLDFYTKPSGVSPGSSPSLRLRIASDGKVSVYGTGAMKVPAGTTGQRPGSSVAGDIRYNSTSSTLEFYTGTAWVGTNVAPSINSITGDIYNGVSGRTLVINCNDITATGNDVRYSNNSNGSVIATDSSASTSGSNITSTIPANVYNTAAGTVIKIEVINSAGVLSSNSLTKTILASPSGGTKTSAGGYWYHTFTSSGTFVNTVANLSVEYLVVAGGGGGGGNQGGGAGGAGGYRTGSATLGTGNYSASIGGGGGNGGNGNSGYGSDGGNSSFNSLTSTGGGGGANMNTGAQTVNGRSGGSGGGASHWLNGNGSGGSGTSGQGNNGGGALDTESLGHNGGGGGGAGASGSNGQGAYGGNGGNGSTWSNGVTYAGGGGGGCYYSNNSGGTPYSIGGGAGTGGGGRGSRNVGSQLSTNFTAPTTNQHGVDGYGGGGGGGGNQPGDGGDGVVIIRYQL